MTKAVPSPKGGSVYDQWKATQAKPKDADQPEIPGAKVREPAAVVTKDVHVGDLGSGSDYTAFLQHLGVPSADVTSHGPYGVYHSAFDDFAWFTKFADPTFVYEQEMARVYGITAMRMASADVLPFNYEEYGKEIAEYVKAAEASAKAAFGEQAPSFADAVAAAARLQKAGAEALRRQGLQGDASGLNLVLRNAERGLLIDGLPGRPWYKHAIYAPGENTGYAAVVIPGVNEAIEKKDLAMVKQQLQILTAAINRAAAMLELGK